MYKQNTCWVNQSPSPFLARFAPSSFLPRARESHFFAMHGSNYRCCLPTSLRKFTQSEETSHEHHQSLPPVRPVNSPACTLPRFPTSCVLLWSSQRSSQQTLDTVNALNVVPPDRCLLNDTPCKPAYERASKNAWKIELKYISLFWYQIF